MYRSRQDFHSYNLCIIIYCRLIFKTQTRNSARDDSFCEILRYIVTVDLFYLFICEIEANSNITHARVCNKLLLNLIFSFADDTIKLSKILSSNYLTHSIHDVYEEFDPRIYDNLEHRNIYVLDLDCDHAVDILRQLCIVSFMILFLNTLLYIFDRNIK